MAAESDTKPRTAAVTAATAARPDDAASTSAAGSDSAAEAGARDLRDTVAVALLHDPEHGDLPRVVASGRGFVADQILALAFSHGVRVRQDADLAQILAQIDLDSEIPTEAFAAVAEILAYVYKANGNTEAWREVTTP